jgi:Skp family chaperone for outer membrane proteins
MMGFKFNIAIFLSLLSLHVALATDWKILGDEVKVTTQDIPTSPQSMGINTSTDRKGQADNLDQFSKKLNEIGTDNQRKLDDASRELSKKWTEARGMPESTPEEKEAKQKRMDEINAAEKELQRVRDWNQKTAFDNARDVSQNAQALRKAATDGSPGGGSSPNAVSGNGNTTLPTAKGATPTSSATANAGEYNSNFRKSDFIGPQADNSFAAPDGKTYKYVNSIADGDTPGTQARYYSNDGGETGYRVGGNGEVHHMERMTDGNYLLGTVQNGSASIGKLSSPSESGYSSFTPRTDVGSITRESFISSAPSSKAYSPDVLSRLPSTTTTNPPSGGTSGGPVRTPAAAKGGYFIQDCSGKTCKKIWVPN